MEDFKAPGFEKWLLFPVEVQQMQTLNLDFKMPGNVRYCAGVAFTVSGLTGAFNPCDCLGEVSLSFNNRKSHLLNFVTEYSTKALRLDQVTLKLEEPIIGGSRINGYYRNLIYSPQKLTIYLQCVIDPF